MAFFKCSPNDVEEGAVVRWPVRAFDGRTLLEAGERFKNEHRRLLAMWGIKEIVVESESTDGEAESFFTAPKAKPDESEIHERFILNLPLSPLLLDLYRLGITAERAQPRDPSGTENEKAFDLGELDRILSSLDGLPSLPRLIHELGAALADPFCSPQRISSIIEKDPSLALGILKLVNSAYYNFPSRIDQLERAVTILGIRQVTALAQSTLLIETFKQIPQELVDMNAFVRHSVAVGVTSRVLANHAKLANNELCYLAGLLHDTGRLFLFVHFPALMQAMMSDSWKEKTALFELERLWLGQDHGEIGARLIAKWNLPLALEKATRYHHDPENSGRDPICDVVHVADVLVHIMECGMSGEFLVPRLNQESWLRLGIGDDRVTDLILECKSLCDLFCDIIDETGGNRG